MSDYEKGPPETDMTHLDEILEKHDYALDAHSGGPEKFRARAMDNFTNRCLHHHVFNLNLLKKIFDFAHIETLRRDEIAESFAASAAFEARER